MILIRNLIKRNDEFTLKIDNLKINENEFIMIVGKSGSGKTTLLNILGLLDKKYEGVYELDDENVANMSNSHLAAIRNQKIGFVFQNYNLIENLSVRENIFLPLKYSKNKRLFEDFDYLCRKSGVDKFFDKRIKHLSGGEKQRVAFLRAIILKPKYLLADEPTGNLDVDNKKIIIDMLYDYYKMGNTVVLISHDKICGDIYDRKYIISNGELCDEK